eukprot:1412096-Prymnesium_polylepis.1
MRKHWNGFRDPSTGLPLPKRAQEALKRFRAASVPTAKPRSQAQSIADGRSRPHARKAYDETD